MTSGRAALMNFATKSIRRRTELMFQVVIFTCMRDAKADSGRCIALFLGLCRFFVPALPVLARDTLKDGNTGGRATPQHLLRKPYFVIDREQAGVGPMDGIQVVNRNGSFIPLRIRDRPLAE